MSVLRFGELLLPKRGTDMTKWAVVACDQYTSSPAYWDKVKEITAGAPSTLSLICPEAYLSEASARLPGIARAAKEYLGNVLVPLTGGVLVERKLEHVTRYGIVCKVDLEAYTYDGSHSPVRATEGTVTERIPPRLAVRRACPLDVSHVMCLIDDEAGRVLAPLIAERDKMTVLYDAPLMLGGGRVTGYHISDTSALTAALEELERASEANDLPFMLVGDGNHSLAAAKALYEEYKAAGDPRAARARYALTEIVDLRSDGIVFEPIHRIMYDAPDFADHLTARVSGEGRATLILGGVKARLSVPSDPAEAYAAVQSAIDGYLQGHPDASVDYIHGAGDLEQLCAERHGTGVLMPALSKDGFFAFVAKKGALPRKSFSMGEAYEKRYYLETAEL